METCRAQNIYYLFKTHRKKKRVGLCITYTQCVLILIFPTMIYPKISNYVAWLTRILDTILSGAVFQYISYNVMQNVLLLHTSILIHPIRKGEEKYIYIYMRCAEVFPFTAVTWAQTRCRTLCANSQCSSDLVYAWNINSRAQRAITFRLKINIHFFTVFLITINENIMSF